MPRRASTDQPWHAVSIHPLVVSSGAGVSSRHEIGIDVTRRMLFATIFGLLLIPVFYVGVRRMLGDKLDEVSKKLPHHDEDPGAPQDVHV